MEDNAYYMPKHTVWYLGIDPPPEKKDGIGRCGYSEDVLIDLEANKTNYRVGWYDFDTKEWRTHDQEHGIKLDSNVLVWQPIFK